MEGRFFKDNLSVLGVVGIGTNDPQRLVTLYKSSTPVLQLVNSTTGTGTSDGFLLLQGGLNTTLENSEAGYMAFRTSANEKMRIDASGNVGIGTASPNSLLDISATAPILTLNSTKEGSWTASEVLGTINFRTSDTSGGGVGTIASIKAVAQDPTTTPNGSLAFSTGATAGFAERMRIDNDGKVGIGTDEPGELLEVDGNIRLGDGGTRDIIGPTNESLRILANPNATNEGIIFSTDGGSTTEMFIQDGGNVGIGTTSPTLGKLQVAGRGYFGPVGTGDATTKALMDTYSVLKLKPHNTNSTNMTFAQVNGGGGIGIQVTNSTQTADWDIALNPYGGHVGIGIVNPQTTLEIFGGQHSSNYPSMLSVVDDETAFDTDNNGGGISFGAKYTSSSIVRFIASIQGVKENNTSGNYGGALRFSIREYGTSTLSEKMRISGTGKVGIGTVSPSSLLNLSDASNSLSHQIGFSYVNGGTKTDAFTIGRNSSTGNLEFHSDINNHGFEFNHNAAGTQEFNILNMNVGIGTTSPNDKLDIYGNMRVRGSDGFGANSTANYNPSFVAYPGGGKIGSSSSPVTGYIKITLPVSWTNTMMQFSVDIFEYQANEAKTFVLAGYNYAAGSSWVNTSAMVLAGDDGTTYKVQFGHDGSKCAIYISKGTDGASSSWTYPYVVVRDASFGFLNAGISNWIDGWSVSFSTATLSGITQTRDISTQVTGTGTSQYITKWNSTGTEINDSVIVQDSSNIGIGTTSPNNGLVVSDGIQPSYTPAVGGEYIEIARTSGADAGFLINKNTGQWLFGIDNSDGTNPPLRFEYSAAGSAHAGFGNATLGLALKYDGNVGIGTTDPNHELEVAGSGDATIRITSTSTNISDDARIGTLQYFSSDTTANTVVGEIVSRTPVGNFGSLFDMAFSTYKVNSGALSEKMRITGAGNVGIGTATPLAKLQVKDSVDDSYESGLSVIRSADNATTWINVKGGATNFNNRNHLENAGLDYRWFQNGSEKMRLNTDGNVGIGTTDTGNHKLKVVGETHSTHFITGEDWTAKTGGLHIGNDGLTTGAVSFYNSVDGGGSANIYRDSNVLYVGARSGVSTRGLAVDVNGNVGIGTDGPEGKLHIFTGDSGGSVNSSADELVIETASTGGITLLNGTTASGYILFGDSGDNNAGQIRYLHTDDSMRLHTSGSERLIIDSSGLVGIGTTSPGSYFGSGNTLVIANTASSAGITIVSNAANSGNIYFSDGTSGSDRTRGLVGYNHAANYMVFHTDAAEAMRIDSSGNVGIGTASPQGKLDINTETAEPTHVYINGEVNQNKLLYFRHYANSEAAANNVALGYIGSNGIDNLLSLGHLNSSGTDVPIMHLTEAGNVGIGTTEPQAQLHIYGGDLDTRAYQQDSSTNSIYLNPTNGNAAGTSNTVGGGVIWKIWYNNYTKKSAGILAIGEGNYFRSGLAFYTNSNANQTTDWSERMRINKDGNVGIGTISPTGGKLQVAGKVRIDAGSGNDALNLDAYDLLKWDNSSHIHFGGYKTGQWTVLKFYAGSTERLNISSDVNVQGATDLNINGPSRRLSFTSGTGTIRTTTSNKLFLQTNSTDALTIDASGNVGIGTTNPTEKLEITGNVRIMPSSGDVKIRLTDQGVRSWDLRVSDGSDYFEIDGTTSTSLVIRGSGNVGIGTISPSQKLHVVGKALITDDVQLTGSSPRIDFNTNGASSLRFYDTTNAAERMRINTSGNLGINTTSPTSKLQVVGSTSGDSVLKVDGTNGTLFEVVDDLSDSLMSVNDAAGLPVFEVFADNTIIGGRYNKNDFYLEGSSGKIGMGTGSPDATGLTIQDTAGDVNSGVRGVFALKNYAGVVTHRFSSSYVTGFASQAYATYWLFNPVNSNTAFYVRADNTLGPRLQLNNSSGSSSVYLSTYAGVPTAFNVGQENIDFNVRGDSDINLFYVDASTDRIGIGTASPTRTLHVVGDTQLDGGLDTSSGAYLSIGGVWTDASSRELKKDIVNLSLIKASEVVKLLNPVEFSYKAAPEERRVGFIAEDVPDLVASEGRKGLSSMQIVAALTKVVQNQQKEIKWCKEQIEKLTKIK